MNIDSMYGYIQLLFALVGFTGKMVMIPETYEEQPMKNQGKIMTDAVIEEG